MRHQTVLLPLLFFSFGFAQYLPNGIQQNFPFSSMPAGWKMHYDQPYTHITKTANLFPAGWNGCFAWGGYAVGSTSFTVIAFGHMNKGGQVTSSTSTAYLDNGAYFYNYPGKSNGFAPTATVRLNTADVGNNDDGLSLSWHLDQNMGGWTIAGDDVHQDPNYHKAAWYGPCTAGSPLPSGIQQNFPIANMPQGWTQHYNQPYTHKTQTANLFPAGWTECFAWGGYAVGSSSFTVVAFGNMNKGGQVTSSTTTAYLDNGAYFYNYPGKSNGFAPTATVKLNSADTGNYNDGLSMSWHLDQNMGGWTLAGDSIHEHSGYYKSAWYGPCLVGGPQPTSLPTKVPTAPPTLALSVSLPYGIQQNFPFNNMPGGWNQHYNQPYSHITKTANLFPAGWTECFAWGGYAKGSSSFMVIAFGHMNQGGQVTSSTTTAYLDNGAYFYNYPGKSNGFSPTATVKLNTADVGNNDDGLSLSWHLDQNMGGWTIAGDNVHQDPNYYKAAWYGPCSTSTRNPTTTNPTSMPTKLPSKRPTTSQPSRQPSSSPTTLAPSTFPTYSPTPSPTKRPTFSVGGTSPTSKAKKCVATAFAQGNSDTFTACSMYNDLASCEQSRATCEQDLNACMATEYAVLLIFNDNGTMKSALVSASDFNELRRKASAAFPSSRTNAYFQYNIDPSAFSGNNVAALNMAMKVQSQEDFKAAVLASGGKNLALEIK